jgi:TonB family protein
VHPLVARLTTSLTFYREAACDGFVLSRTGGARKSYANLLFSLAQGRILEPVPALSIHSHPSQLKQRIQAMSNSEPKASQKIGRIAALLILIATTGLAACTDPAATSGQEDAPDPQARLVDPGEDVFSVVEDMPTLIGGINSVAEAVQYPAVAKEAGIEGRVVVEFIVDQQGAVQDASVAKGVHEALDAEALRVVKSLAFEPGMQNGKTVKVKMALPIAFRLQ